MPAIGALPEFGGTERFVLEGRIGRGGMGVVYRARDKESALPVALKTMAHMEPSALLRFKNEFRALADISHPNVVQLYEMASAGEHWFFTMELLRGVDFLRWVQRAELEEASSWTDSFSTMSPTSALLNRELRREVETAESGVISAARQATPPRAFDLARLRPALLQLARGVAAIHAAGKLHRDIKPSNVMVTEDARVVLLDFGVVGDQHAARDNPRLENQILGTPAYMAPEQARGVPPGMAADWYAVGLIMYEALTDRLPFEGSPHDILFGKRGRVVAPGNIVPGVPRELDALCMDLLHPDPRRRPLGEEVLQRLSHAESGGSVGATTLAPASNRPFVGRKSQLQALTSAFEQSLRGQAAAVLLAGRSGMGKTMLAQHFLERVRREHEALVLSGRCFEREASPFKGMDGVVDELSRHLTALPARELASLLPAGLHCLARVFPVLRALPSVANVPPPEHEIIEPIELRKRAFAALKELLCAVGERQPLIVHLDDVQWSDIDSLVLLEQLLQPPNAPKVLFICAYRDDLEQPNPVLVELFTVLSRFPNVGQSAVSVARFSAEEAIELAQRSLAADARASAGVARAIALESQGVPLFSSELAEWQLGLRDQPAPATHARAGEPPWGVSLERVIQSRVADLPPDASRLLEVLSVANGPLRYAVAEQTAGTPRNDALRARLRAARLVRSFRVEGEEYVEVYHARVRDSVVVTLSAEHLRQWHGALARVLEESGRADPEALVEHYLAAGDRDRARQHVLAAAEAAEGSLAFMRAARLYRRAIDVGTERSRHDLLKHSGDALVHAGRSSDAADTYAEAVRAAPREDATELQRLAAEHYLKSGRDSEGLGALGAVLQGVGLRYPRSSAAALTSLLYHRAHVRVRGLSFRPTASERCLPRDLTRVDVAFSATAGLAMVDVIRGADFGAQHLLLALQMGEPIRICRALAFEAGNAAAVGAGSRVRIERLGSTAESLARQTLDPHGLALAKVAAGLVHVFSGEWRTARSVLDDAEALLRDRCRAVTWELTNTQAWSCNSLILCGNLREAAARVPNLIGEATERSDRYALMHMIYPACITALVANDVDRAWRVATNDATFRSCEPDKFTAGHWGSLISTQSVHRYRGEGKRARAFVGAAWHALESSQFLRVHLMRVFSEFERVLSLIAAADDGARDADLLRGAEQSIKRVLRDSPRYAAPMGQYLAGCLAAAKGNSERALLELKGAAHGLQAVDMGYLALCARQRYAQLLGGDAGRELTQQGKTEFEAQGVVDIAACLTMSTPGFRRSMA